MKRILFLLFLALAPLCLRAQGYEAVEVTVSTEKANIAGKVYYLHKVLPRQTVYSICKAYGTTEQELAAANPDLKDGLKAGSILLIPVSASAGRTVDAAPDTVATVAVTADEDGDDEIGFPSEAPEGQRIIEHRVRWYESLSSIARKYGVTPAEIWDYNDLRESDSIRGRTLKIPVKGQAAVQTADDDEIAEDEAEEAENDAEAVTEPVRTVRRFTAQDPLRLSLVLPIDAGRNASSSFLNFYSGALMAIQEQKDKGAHVIVNTFDLAQGAESILADPRFRESDLVIGPAEASTLGPFLRYADESGTILVSPLDHKADSLVSGHPTFFQAPASADIQIRNLAASLAGRGHGPVILAYSNFSGETALVAQLESSLQAAGISYRKAPLSELGGLVSGGSAAAPARVLIGSENKNFCADVIRSLNTLAKKNSPVEVWCTNRVRNYDTSDPDALFNLSVHTTAPYFVDYSNPDGQQFILRYRALFYAEPDDFAFQGHDILTYFIAAMMQQGTAFADHADLISMQLLHCDFRFVREDEESGWRNHATRNLYYDKSDYSIVLTK